MIMLEIAMYTTSLSVLCIINEGYLVRDGIAVGDVFMDELGFFGSAIEEDYKNEFEPKHNRMSLILLDKKLGKKFQEYIKSVQDLGNNQLNIKKLFEVLFSHEIPNLVEYRMEIIFEYFYKLKGEFLR